MCNAARKFSIALVAFFTAISVASSNAYAGSGLIAAEEGGANGYQHGVERTRFAAGRLNEQTRTVEEFGFSKVLGANGVIATNLRNGLVIATQNSATDKNTASTLQERANSSYPFSPEKHNEMVIEYFVAAGIPKEQIGGIHANTYLSGGGKVSNSATVRKVDGYASVLKRVVGNNFLVAESIAWARLDSEGKSTSEWVYWPAIPAKALADARRIEELTTGQRREEYLSRLPAGLVKGSTVIHHSAATDEGSFEALATYDVVERRDISPEGLEKISKAPQGEVIVRHFDAEGLERRLPSERFSLGVPDLRAK